jgi:hypothetical protein
MNTTFDNISKDLQRFETQRERKPKGFILA